METNKKRAPITRLPNPMELPPILVTRHLKMKKKLLPISVTRQFVLVKHLYMYFSESSIVFSEMSTCLSETLTYFNETFFTESLSNLIKILQKI